ncbi:uncharacterized protein THITE_2113863 [Thermothielavioides terrestris NRRL 8126]|uniref:Zn(2)-C6 fungal-type domain-containing protein n=1 Tax=Thermothielavioides terrestris (strain ATCC 38088 / NRRL 8126) TaxID=578455 RepID=G2R4B9_THETT|nr:uncharacterized protein THITE_2113863 [Thermothielavioides terrestris NRRL 8126]AEO66066.1 hypothetical protein THITE_2113863 [Thermothielavioides terrestris NRRL 8126]
MATTTTTTTTTKGKSASKAGANANPKQKTQMHRRSRTGCYTCRLRRKKCDEGSPMCTACKHLGLACEYKRPMWWSNNDARRKHKDDIKMIIKRKKLSEKSTHTHTIQTSVGSPPGLSHSLPTSATFSDPLDRARSASIDSHFGFNFNSPQSSHDFGPFTPQMRPEFMFSPYSPYEIDVKTERQMFINDVPTLRESTTSTFSTYATPPPPGTILPQFPLEGEWTEQVYSERRESLTEETLNVNFFDFSQGPVTASRQVAIELDEGDQRLLDHFVQFVLPTIFPILELNQHGPVSSDLILPALQNNKGYLHCCLSIAAQHYKAAMGLQGDEIDGDIMRHRYATISALCDALNRDENHQQILEAALGLIFFQCGVGRFDDTLPDIPWHQHFQAVHSLVQKLDLPRIVSDPNEPLTQTPFNMTLTAWIDILGATMQGRAPAFAHTYREKHLSAVNPSLGLRELMGCEDRVMYLISEIACLEALKRDGMDDITLCQHVHVLGDQIGLTELGEGPPVLPFNANGSLSPKQLSKNMTAAFRLAARIYLCSLVPGFSPAQASCIGLVDKLTAVLQHVPSGPHGFDRSLAWVYLIGGSVSLAGSPFRAFFDDRVAQLGDLANFGSFGRVACLLREVWLRADQLAQQQQQPQPQPQSSQQQQQLKTESSPAAEAPASPEAPLQPLSQPHTQYIHWRDVMQMKGWDYLLI